MLSKSKATPINIKLEDLQLDLNNPRFAELYSGSHNEDDLIEYLLYTEAAEEVAAAIVKAGEFYPDRPLWVLKQDSKFLVKDGNRRCSAVKALQMPGKYKLSLPKTTLQELPVLLYDNQADIDERIVEEHAGNLFRRWERIAKALEVLKLTESGRWDDVKELDSKPGDLIKLASFYKEAVKHGGDDLRLLLRRGRGKKGGKTIIFERLFRNSILCGYSFKNSPSFLINVNDNLKFALYITSLVTYLKDNPDTTTETIDKDKDFLARLKIYGFDAYQTNTSTASSTTTNPATTQGTPTTTSSNSTINTSSNSTPTTTNATSVTVQTPPNSTTTNSKKGSVKKSPSLKRKGIPPGLKNRIQEYFLMDSIIMPNSKVAMARVTFECVLKYVVENTKFNGRTNMSKSGHFGPVYKRPPYTDFGIMKTKFIDLINNTGESKAFQAFDLDDLHTIVHNYKVNAISVNAEQISYNLIGLIEFMLQDESDLLDSLDLTKL
jgi:hypothetical protein